MTNDEDEADAAYEIAERERWRRETLSAYLQRFCTIVDTSAVAELGKLLTTCLEPLRRQGVDPVAIAACPSCFNDVASSENWRAVRAGDFVWTNEAYFEPRKNLDVIRQGPPIAMEAFASLENLEACNWRAHFERGFGRSLEPGEVTALICQAGQALFVVVDSYGEDGAVYRVANDGALNYLGVCDRLDDRMRRKVQPLRWVEQSEWIAGSSPEHAFRWAPDPIKMTINGAEITVRSAAQLEHEIASRTSERFLDVAFETEDRGSVRLLTNADRGWLQRLIGPARFRSHNAQYEGDAHALVEFRRSNGDVEQRPASWTFDMRTILRTMRFFMEVGFISHPIELVPQPEGE